MQGQSRAGRKARKAAGRRFWGGQAAVLEPQERPLRDRALQVERPQWKLEKPLDAAVPIVKARKATGRCSA